MSSANRTKDANAEYYPVSYSKSSSHLGEGEEGGGRYKIKQATEMK